MPIGVVGLGESLYTRTNVNEDELMKFNIHGSLFYRKRSVDYHFNRVPCLELKG